HNGVLKLEGLEHNLKLNTLDVTSNRVSKLENISHLVHLEELWASSNRLDSYEEVEEQCSGLKDLRTVYFEGNPLQTEQRSEYRRRIKQIIPHLTQIDGDMCKPDPNSP
ncbi:Protein phosphatase 1 regulatory subunit 7, partial [Spiromyces aspiralis]